MKTWWVCAAPREAECLRGAGPLPARDRLLVTGVGKVAAAASLSRALALESPDAIVAFGVCGAYAGSGLAVAQSCLIVSDRFADEGVETPDGFLDLAALGLGSSAPLQAAAGLRELLVAATGGRPVAGATVSCCSGTDALARRYTERCGAEVETMEGAAIAFVASTFGVPWVQLRAVSNRCGDRAQGGWDLGRACERLRECLVVALPAMAAADPQNAI